MNVRIQPSPIHGRGVFANEQIEEGSQQFVYGDVRTVLPGDPIEKYGLERYDEKTYIPYAPWCCCNHSKDPNCEIGELDSQMLMISVLRTIEPDEEITIDYGFDPSNETDS